jgi:hypothetical protein
MQMSRSIAIFLLAILVGNPALSAELGEVQPHHYASYHRGPIALAAERHVIEVAEPPYSGSFIINGTNFAARSPACLSWTAGDRVTLKAGDWHGYCVGATFYNVTRHQACQMWCGTQAAY